ncbi:hypothetical protein CDAR_50811 [Caerostris darwini]|uniref:Uncharacterized protein n=1 Tax=Caerostris darwini TaxID=1538125 RepID=A0AAV4U5Y4_9ARAC|nr:hypothetical protein CDAR_50811 [Caerostris darwini]
MVCLLVVKEKCIGSGESFKEWRRIFDAKCDVGDLGNNDGDVRFHPPRFDFPVEHPICNWTTAIPYLPPTTAGTACCFCLSVSITTSTSRKPKGMFVPADYTKSFHPPPPRSTPIPPQDKTTPPTSGLRSPIIQQNLTIAECQRILR